MHIETVDVAIFQGDLVQIIGSENTPIGLCVQAYELRVPHIIHFYPIAVIILARVRALDGHILHGDVGAVVDGDGCIRRQGAGRRVDSDILQQHIILITDFQQVCLIGGARIAHKSQIPDKVHGVRPGAHFL